MPAIAFIRTLVLLSVSLAAAAGAVLSIEGDAFLLDGRPFDMWGIRTASAAQSEVMTKHLVAQLDEYRRYGVNSVSVYYMGNRALHSDPFSEDGVRVDPDHQKRMETIIRECDRRGMAVIVGIFYQRADPPRLRDWDAATKAVETVAKALRPYRNVILNIANEQNSANYKQLPWSRVMNAEDVIELCRVVRRADPRRLVGAGGYDPPRNEIIGRSPEVNVLLFDTAGPQSSLELYRRYRAAGVTGKPMVNVETFGAWTDQFHPQGVFPEEVRRQYLREVDEAARVPGLYLHFHNSPWCQSIEPGVRPRYDLGGRGTSGDPGIRWYFEYVQKMAAKGP